MISSIQHGTGQTEDALLTNADQARQTREQAQVAREVDCDLLRIRDMSVQTEADAKQTLAASP